MGKWTRQQYFAGVVMVLMVIIAFCRLCVVYFSYLGEGRCDQMIAAGFCWIMMTKSPKVLVWQITTLLTPRTALLVCASV